MNISSEITLDDMPMMTLYAATKRGLNAFTGAMSKELRREGIRVTLVILGAVGDTGIDENFSAKLQKLVATIAGGSTKAIALTTHRQHAGFPAWRALNLTAAGS